MTKYLINRILRSVVSIVIVVMVVMVLIYSCLDKTLIFQSDPNFSKKASNEKEVYMLQQWERYGYVDYVSYSDWLKAEMKAGNITQETYDAVVKFADKAEFDSEEVAEYVAKFTQHYRSKGYQVIRLDADKKMGSKNYKAGGAPRLYAYQDIPVLNRLWNYLTGLIAVDNIHYVEEDIEDRGLSFTWYDPAYGGDVF